MNCFSNYEKYGFSALENGTKLIAKTPWIGPNAWLHVIYPSIEQIGAKKIKDKLPMASNYLSGILSEMNGLRAFSGALSLYGYKEEAFGIDRSTSLAAFQPFDIFLANIKERPPWLNADEITIAFYDWDGSEAVLRPDGSIFRVTMNGERKNRWSNVSEFIKNELTRLSSLFDETGRPKNPEVPTIP